MTTHNTRKKKCLEILAQKEFAVKFNIPLGTVKNWDARDCMPEYIMDFAIEIYRLKRLYNDLWKRVTDEDLDLKYELYGEAKASLFFVLLGGDNRGFSLIILKENSIGGASGTHGAVGRPRAFGVGKLRVGVSHIYLGYYVLNICDVTCDKILLVLHKIHFRGYCEKSRILQFTCISGGGGKMELKGGECMQVSMDGTVKICRA